MITLQRKKLAPSRNIMINKPPWKKLGSDEPRGLFIRITLTDCKDSPKGGGQ
jgi:hypothetical protein